MSKASSPVLKGLTILILCALPILIAAGEGRLAGHQRILAADAPGGAVLIVRSTADSGPGSLRQAILDANTLPGPDTIVFAIPLAGLHIIRPASPLPAVMDEVLIDGFSQPGAAWPARKALRGDVEVGTGAASPQIVLDGSGAGLDAGLRIVAANCTVRSLAIRGFAQAEVWAGHSPHATGSSRGSPRARVRRDRRRKRD